MKTVYAHFAINLSLIYIGEGGNNRPTDRRSRPADWHTKATDGFYAVPLIQVATDTEATHIEQLLINWCATNGYSLTNVRGGVSTDPLTANDYTALATLVNLLHYPSTLFQSYKINSKIGRSKKAKYKFIGTCLDTGNVIECVGNHEIEEAGFNQGHVSRCANGLEVSHNGYTWKKALIV